MPHVLARLSAAPTGQGAFRTPGPSGPPRMRPPRARLHCPVPWQAPQGSGLPDSGLDEADKGTSVWPPPPGGRKGHLSLGRVREGEGESVRVRACTRVCVPWGSGPLPHSPASLTVTSRAPGAPHAPRRAQNSRKTPKNCHRHPRPPPRLCGSLEGWACRTSLLVAGPQGWVASPLPHSPAQPPGKTCVPSMPLEVPGTSSPAAGVLSRCQDLSRPLPKGLAWGQGEGCGPCPGLREGPAGVRCWLTGPR